ncbi:TRAP transporter small permease subunit [Spiribacter sp. 2438]|uniref:TRAP transporter small permease subunit n=1 Tax=Spiribacter sp. 2438 TaxID=2666185 RepID=UPI0012B1494C|nr:TRAP transporter small permease subunit [Spiribacter sp. 2438]QGM21858.1 TRAP transporter small permease subunit [Spiribacter sp. 2438]
MNTLRAFSRQIDRLTDWVGFALRWLALALVAVGVINVVGRYLGAQLGMQLSSNALLEFQLQAFSVIFLLGASYLLRHDGHIRVDILNNQLKPRTRAWIDLVGTVGFLLPFCLVMIHFSVDFVVRSWSRLEVSPNPGGLPLYPIKTMLLVAFVLLLLQGISHAIKCLDRLAGAPK